MLTPTLEMGADTVHSSTHLVSADLVHRANGLQVNVWTANCWSTLRALLELGVDGVFTNYYPERAVIWRLLKGHVSEPPDQVQDDVEQ